MSSSRRICFISCLLVVGVVDDEPAADPDRLAVAPEDPGAERVERARLDVATRLADERDDPLAQLAGGAVRERHREDLPRPDALDADEVGDPMGEDAGLAAAGAGEDQERPVGRRDGAGLLRVEAADDLLGARFAAACFACRFLLGLARPPLVGASARGGASPGSGGVAQPVRLRGGRRCQRPRSSTKAVPSVAWAPSAGVPAVRRRVVGLTALIVGRAAFTRPSRRAREKPRAGGSAARGSTGAGNEVATGRSGPPAGPRRRP